MNSVEKIKGILLLLVTALLMSCRAGDDTELNTAAYKIEAKFNGELKVFDKLESFGNIKIISLNEYQSVNFRYGTQNSKYGYVPGASLRVGNLQETPLTVGNYTEENSNVGFEYFVAENQSTYTSEKFQTKDFKITVTKYTNTIIEGTFSGTLENADGVTIKVSEGHFVAPGTKISL